MSRPWETGPAFAAAEWKFKREEAARKKEIADKIVEYVAQHPGVIYHDVCVALGWPKGATSEDKGARLLVFGIMKREARYGRLIISDGRYYPR